MLAGDDAMVSAGQERSTEGWPGRGRELDGTPLAPYAWTRRPGLDFCVLRERRLSAPAARAGQRRGPGRDGDAIRFHQPRVSVRADPGGDRFGDDRFFPSRITCAEEDGRVAHALLCGNILLDQLLEDPHLADSRVAAFRDGIGDLGRPVLAVPIDPAVPLLESEKRPGQVEMDEPVALKMQVQALGRHVRGDGDPQRRLPLTEILNHLLHADIGLDAAAVDPGDLVIGKAEIQLSAASSARRRGDPLREDQARISLRSYPSPGLSREVLVLAERGRVDRRDFGREGTQTGKLKPKAARRPRKPKKAAKPEAAKSKLTVVH